FVNAPLMCVSTVFGPSQSVREIQRLGPVRRHGGTRGVHRASLDHGARHPAPIRDLAAAAPSGYALTRIDVGRYIDACRWKEAHDVPGVDRLLPAARSGGPCRRGGRGDG